MLTLTGAGGAAPSPHVPLWHEILTNINWGIVLGGFVLVAGVGWWAIAERRSSRPGQRPFPILAESILCIFARSKDIDALMGDFEELFARDVATGMSSRRAVVRYWARVLRSIGPQIWQAIKRVSWLGLLATVLGRSGG